MPSSLSAVRVETFRVTGAGIPVSPSALTRERGPVLIVDADSSERRVLRLVLEGAGFRCYACASLGEASALTGACHPRLVLSDVALEGPEGQELASELAAPGSGRPRIALMSAYPRTVRGSEDYFFRKPIHFDRLLRVLDSVEAEAGGT